MFRTISRLVVLTVIVCLPSLLPSSAAAGEIPQSVVIERVENGNTLITTGGLRLRLIDIRLPEAKAVQDSLIEFLKEQVEGKSVLLERDFKERDWDGALLVYVFVDGNLLNEEVLYEGLARMKRRTVNTRHQRSFFRSQASAYREGRGLWGNGAAQSLGKSAGNGSGRKAGTASTAE